VLHLRQNAFKQVHFLWSSWVILTFARCRCQQVKQEQEERKSNKSEAAADVSSSRKKVE